MNCTHPSGACKNEGSSNFGGLCSACFAWPQTHDGQMRPERFCRWPKAGHPLLSGSEACRVTGVTYRQLDYAVSRGLVSPTVPADGSGTVRGFDLEDCVTLAAVVRLDPKKGSRLGLVQAVSLATAIAIGQHRWTDEYAPGVSISVDVRSIRAEIRDRWPADRPHSWSPTEVSQEKNARRPSMSGDRPTGVRQQTG